MCVVKLNYSKKPPCSGATCLLIIHVSCLIVLSNSGQYVVLGGGGEAPEVKTADIYVRGKKQNLNFFGGGHITLPLCSGFTDVANLGRKQSYQLNEV